MIYSFVLSMAFMVDTIIAGHFLGTDAVAAIALRMPGIGIMLSLTAMILQGAFIKLLNAMGRNDMEDYHRLLTLALICTTIVDCIFISLCLFKTSAVLMAGGAGKASPQAVMLGELYLRAACLDKPEVYFLQPETSLLYRDMMVMRGASLNQLKPVRVIMNERHRKFFFALRQEMDE